MTAFEPPPSGAIARELFDKIERDNASSLEDALRRDSSLLQRAKALGIWKDTIALIEESE